MIVFCTGPLNWIPTSLPKLRMNLLNIQNYTMIFLLLLGDYTFIGDPPSLIEDCNPFDRYAEGNLRHTVEWIPPIILSKGIKIIPICCVGIPPYAWGIPNEKGFPLLSGDSPHTGISPYCAGIPFGHSPCTQIPPFCRGIAPTVRWYPLMCGDTP